MDSKYFRDWGDGSVGEMAQLVNCMLCEQENQSSIARTHFFLNPDVVVYAYNARVKEAKTSESLGFGGQPA